MTYNWNNMVSITVPTGTNGWLYSGEVIINGVKVRFPVGVHTSVPEPAAVLLKKMIELEQEEDANTAKPQNHYVGDVTIPAGKTLTLEKGAKFVDNSGPSEVVILPETELTLTSVSGDMSVYHFYAPPENVPTAGAKCKLMWGGMEYTNTVVDISATIGAHALLLGNTDLMAEEGMDLENPDADAPYCVMLVPDGNPLGEGDQVAYGVIMSIGITPDPPVLSIVQVGAASGGASDSPVFVVKVNNSGGYTADKTYGETLSALNAGKLVYFIVSSEGLIAVTALVSYFMDKIIATFDQTLNNQKLHWSSDGSLNLKD